MASHRRSSKSNRCGQRNKKLKGLFKKEIPYCKNNFVWRDCLDSTDQEHKNELVVTDKTPLL